MRAFCNSNNNNNNNSNKKDTNESLDETNKCPVRRSCFANGTDGDARAKVVKNFIQKAAIGFGAGLALGLLVFRRRAVSVAFCTGIGLGIGWEQAKPIIMQCSKSICHDSSQSAGPFATSNNSNGACPHQEQNSQNGKDV